MSLCSAFSSIIHEYKPPLFEKHYNKLGVLNKGKFEKFTFSKENLKKILWKMMINCYSNKKYEKYTKGEKHVKSVQNGL